VPLVADFGGKLTLGELSPVVIYLINHDS